MPVRSRSVAPVIGAIQADGVKTPRVIARELVARMLETRRGGAWPPVQVTDLLKKLQRVAA